MPNKVVAESNKGASLLWEYQFREVSFLDKNSLRLFLGKCFFSHIVDYCNKATTRSLNCQYIRYLYVITAGVNIDSLILNTYQRDLMP